MIHATGVTYATGFKAWGEHVGLKRFKKDLALLVSDVPATAAAVFTTNLAKAAPIQWNQEVLAGGNKVKAILINSGQANSCTGMQGVLNAAAMAETLANSLQCGVNEIMLASTGIIGAQINMVNALAGIPVVASKVRSDQFAAGAAAEAIITTDSCVKKYAIDVELGGCAVKIGAMAKGSGMVHPNMATMLSFIATDANITAELLQKALKETVDCTYNMISVDGDTSTNDMVAILANGLAGNELISEENDDYRKFCGALYELNTFLARKIASDVNGVTKRLAVTVEGARTVDDARKIARRVVSSNLVKASMHKADANWGRVMAAVGSAGVPLDVLNVAVDFLSESGTVCAFANGEQSLEFCAQSAATVLSAPEIAIVIRLEDGDARATAWGCDMEFDPIRTSKAQAQMMEKLLAEVG